MVTAKINIKVKIKSSGLKCVIDIKGTSTGMKMNININKLNEIKYLVYYKYKDYVNLYHCLKDWWKNHSGKIVILMEEHNCVACAIFDIRETDGQAHGWTDRLTRSLSVSILPRQHKNNTV